MYHNYPKINVAAKIFQATEEEWRTAEMALQAKRLARISHEHFANSRANGMIFIKKIISSITIGAAKCTPKASRYDHIFSVAATVNIVYYSFLGRFSNM